MTIHSIYRIDVGDKCYIESRGLIEDPGDLQVVPEIKDHYEKTICDYVLDTMLDEICEMN